MTVNFNNLRKQALYAYDRLATELNEAIKADQLDELVADDIQSHMDDLRMKLFSIAGCYLEGNEDIKDVSEGVGEIAWYRGEE